MYQNDNLNYEITNHYLILKLFFSFSLLNTAYLSLYLRVATLIAEIRPVIKMPAPNKKNVPQTGNLLSAKSDIPSLQFL